MTTTTNLRVFLVDDEALALKRLGRLLSERGQIEILGQETDPLTALTKLNDATLRQQIDALFLDIQMPILNGFDLLSRLDWQPCVIFTTAFDEYALQAFDVHSIDYLLKPIEAAQLDRALQKLTRLNPPAPSTDFRNVIEHLASAMQKSAPPARIASRLGERIRFIELAQISHFFAQDKLTYAATSSGQYVIDRTITELETELESASFVRIHRAVLLNTAYVEEVRTWFGGRLNVRLNDAQKTELTVARERVKELRDKLGF